MTPGAETGAGNRAFFTGRWPRRLLVILAFVVLVLVAFHGIGGWYFASQIDQRGLSAEARREALAPRNLARVVAVSGDSVTLRQPGDKRLPREGVFGLTWDGGWGTAGNIVHRGNDGEVTREFRQHSGTPLVAGMRASLNSRVYQGDPMSGLGIPFQSVHFAGELGEYPAWYIPGGGSTWFIFVHGNSMSRTDGLRILPAVLASGRPVLVPTYRGDANAPDDPSGRLSYGKNEWRDLEAAVQYALDHGAESVVIEGVSMGGAVTVAFLLESPLAARVSGVILESPMLNFEAAVEYQASGEKLPLIGLALPGTLVDAAEWFAARRFGVDWEYTDYLDRIDRLETPILLIHGEDDAVVPVSTSRALAEGRPDLVTDFWVVPGAGHVEGWNASSMEYEERVVRFLQDHATMVGR
jgi:pimeloyl-ACP methyl ester carboxylesterase